MKGKSLLAALIALGANLLVDNGTIIAQAMGVPESVIALTFVALGTSLKSLRARPCSVSTRVWCSSCP